MGSFSDNERARSNVSSDSESYEDDSGSAGGNNTMLIIIAVAVIAVLGTIIGVVACCCCGGLSCKSEELKPLLEKAGTKTDAYKDCGTAVGDECPTSTLCEANKSGNLFAQCIEVETGKEGKKEKEARWMTNYLGGGTCDKKGPSLEKWKSVEKLRKEMEEETDEAEQKEALKKWVAALKELEVSGSDADADAFFKQVGIDEAAVKQLSPEDAKKAADDAAKQLETKAKPEDEKELAKKLEALKAAKAKKSCTHDALTHELTGKGAKPDGIARCGLKDGDICETATLCGPDAKGNIFAVCQMTGLDPASLEPAWAIYPPAIDGTQYSCSVAGPDVLEKVQEMLKASKDAKSVEDIKNALAKLGDESAKAIEAWKKENA